ISQTSRSPVVAGPVVKAIWEPSGETDQAQALSRSLRGTAPRTETTHTLLGSGIHSRRIDVVEVTTNCDPAGNHAATDQYVPLCTNSSGWGTRCSSLVATTLR